VTPKNENEILFEQSIRVSTYLSENKILHTPHYWKLSAHKLFFDNKEVLVIISINNSIPTNPRLPCALLQVPPIKTYICLE
jgi:hypothetical protein